MNPLEPARPTRKVRFSERGKQVKQAKQPKGMGPKPDALAPAAPDAAEVADRQTQATPLGLAGDTSKKKKKAPPPQATRPGWPRKRRRPKLHRETCPWRPLRKLQLRLRNRSSNEADAPNPPGLGAQFQARFVLQSQPDAFNFPAAPISYGEIVR